MCRSFLAKADCSKSKRDPIGKNSMIAKKHRDYTFRATRDQDLIWTLDSRRLQSFMSYLFLMAEAAIFIVVLGGIVVSLTYALGNPQIHPLFILLPIVLLLVPGFYAAVVSGPFVPSARKRTQSMLKLANLKSDDTAYDMGFGDGRLIFAAAKQSKKAIGYELSIPLYLFGLIRKVVSRSKVHIRFGDIWKQDYRDANVIFCYLLPKAMTRFYKEVWPTLKPGTRVISNAFTIHEIQPIQVEDKVYLYQT
jgi:hypothetical protein